MKKRLIIAVVVVAVLGMGIASGWVFNGNSDSSEPGTVTLTMPQVVLNDIVIRYGEGIEVKRGPEKAETQYITYIVANGYLKAVMWVNGLMYEVASVSLATPAPSPAGE